MSTAYRPREWLLAASAASLWARHWPALPRLEIEVRLSRRLVSSAGYYDPRRLRIVLSCAYAERHGENETLGILLHELVHHAVHVTHGAGARPHGAEFRAEMRRVGCPRHCQDTTPLKRLAFRCPGCGHIYRRQRRPPRGGVACGSCCNRHAGGRFDRRFLLVPMDRR